MITEDNLIEMFKRLFLHHNSYMMTVIQLLLPIYIYLAIGAEWYWWLVCVFFYFIYLSIGNNVGMHRYFCHRYFTMSKPVEWFVTWAATCTGLGSPLSYAAVHVIHHNKYDTNLDPHGPKRGWLSLLYCFHRTISGKDICPNRSLMRLAKEYRWLHEYYWAFVFGTGVAFYLLGGLNLFLFCWAIPSSLTLWAAAFVLLLQHDKHGPSNTRNYMWFGWGETWHKNHHDDPSLVDHSLGQGRDWTYQLCKILSKSEKPL
jgi:stearoyl-CoA desaturase (delta-9 desaturase)